MTTRHVWVCLMIAGTVVPVRLVLAQNNRSNGPTLGAETRPAMQLALQEALPSPSSIRDEARTAASRRSRKTQAQPQVQTGPEQVLYSFQSGSDGASPSSGLIFDSSGNLYGTTLYGGGGPCSANGYSGCGTVFKLSPNGSGGWTETVIYSFQGGSDGQGPSDGLILDQAGNLYGTTGFAGGTTGCPSDCGTVFELSPNSNGGWTKTILYSFQGATGDGVGPQGVIFDQSGNLYGTTFQGGNDYCDLAEAQFCGTIYELSPNGSGSWTETILYSFPRGVSAYFPNPGLIFDHSGNLYGTTLYGGGDCSGSGGCGTVFELSPNGSGSWTETLLYGFQGKSDGNYPYWGVIFDQSGNLYGTAADTQEVEGVYGTVFELSPNGSGGWTETTIHSFQGSNDGASPLAGLIFDQSGNLYGTTADGGGGNCPAGVLGCGTVFELSPNGSGGWTETLLYSFQGGSDGDYLNSPSGPLIFDQSGNLYGTTPGGGGTGCGGSGCGVVFEVMKAPAATLSTAGLTFGNQNPGTTSSPQALTVTNNGRLPLTITAIQIIGTNSSDFAQTNNCPASLSQDNSCNVSVTFTPTGAGSRNAELQFTDNAAGSPQGATLSGTGADFSLSVTSQTSVTVTPGQAANYAITVSPVNGFAQKVTFSCSQAPPQSTCAITPSSVTLDGTDNAQVNVAVVTSGTSAALTHPDSSPLGRVRSSPWIAAWLALSILPGIVLFYGGFRKSQRRLVLDAALLCLLSFVLMWSACGKGGGTSGGGTPVGTYNPIVTGSFTSGPANVVHSTTLTLIVQ